MGKNNYGPDLELRWYSTGQIVNDILDVIRAEKLNSYIVHGQSYGSIVATELGYRVSHQAMTPQPRGIILTGIAYDNVMSHYFSGYNRQLVKLMTLYSRTQRTNVSLELRKILSELFNNNPWAFSNALMYALLNNIEDPRATRVQNLDVRRFFDSLSRKQIEKDNPVYSH